MMNGKVLLVGFLVIGQFALAQNKERFKKSAGKESSPPEEAEEIVEEPDQEEKLSVEKGSFDWGKVVYGGNLSLGFGTSTFIYLSPGIGYRTWEKFITGAGFIYQYTKVRWVGSASPKLREPIENQICGPKVFANYFPTDYFYVGISFEYLNHGYDPRNNQIFSEKAWTSVLFLEAGFTKQIGSKGFAFGGIRYNLLHDMDSPYASSFYPIFGIYF